MDSGPRTTVSIPRAVRNGASVASAHAGCVSSGVATGDSAISMSVRIGQVQGQSGKLWRSAKLLSNTRTNHSFVRVLALAFTSDGPAGKSCSLICETVAG